nr:immunoglobulin heavy chain junction region [Mus musculus]MBK4185014.1 immunoglobulin heavy chain junction region [Mus musculus]MBK4185015.1 immunoglobulin heavy chain junction region [Mus musculus]
CVRAGTNYFDYW